MLEGALLDVPGVTVPVAVVPVPVVGVLAPGVAVVGVAPGVAVVAVLAPGVAVVGVVVVAGVVGVTGALAAGAVVTVVVTVVVAGLADELEPPASFTSAAASTPSASAAMAASVAIGIFQLGVAARRVRAAAPQFRHHSCSGCSGEPHSGQASLPGTRAGTATRDPPTAAPGASPVEPASPVGFLGAAAIVTSRPPVGG
jgi:hypothetical protein